MDGDAKFLSFDKAGVDENLNEKNTRAMLRRETGVGVWVTRQFTYPPGSLLLCYMPRSHSLASTWQRYKYLYWSSTLHYLSISNSVSNAHVFNHGTLIDDNGCRSPLYDGYGSRIVADFSLPPEVSEEYSIL